jgi:hypothetical protein
MAVIDDLLGDPSGTTNLAEGDLRRVMRRAQRFAGRGGHVAQDRAAEQDALARQIAEAMRMRDAVSARNLIDEAARLGYSHTAMLRAVEEQTQQERLEQMDAARDVEEPYHELGPADRQRRNLAQFEVAGELVRAWRAGNLSVNSRGF